MLLDMRLINLCEDGIGHKFTLLVESDAILNHFGNDDVVALSKDALDRIFKVEAEGLEGFNLGGIDVLKLLEHIRAVFRLLLRQTQRELDLLFLRHTCGIEMLKDFTGIHIAVATTAQLGNTRRDCCHRIDKGLSGRYRRREISSGRSGPPVSAYSHRRQRRFPLQQHGILLERHDRVLADLCTRSCRNCRGSGH